MPCHKSFTHLKTGEELKSYLLPLVPSTFPSCCQMPDMSLTKHDNTVMSFLFVTEMEVLHTSI